MTDPSSDTGRRCRPPRRRPSPPTRWDHLGTHRRCRLPRRHPCPLSRWDRSGTHRRCRLPRRHPCPLSRWDRSGTHPRHPARHRHRCQRGRPAALRRPCCEIHRRLSRQRRRGLAPPMVWAGGTRNRHAPDPRGSFPNPSRCHCRSGPGCAMRRKRWRRRSSRPSSASESRAGLWCRRRPRRTGLIPIPTRCRRPSTPSSHRLRRTPRWRRRGRSVWGRSCLCSYHRPSRQTRCSPRPKPCRRLLPLGCGQNPQR